MSDKLISLPQLQEYKTYADAKYQNKLTAGSNIYISGNTISSAGTPTYAASLSTSVAVQNNTVTKLGEVLLQPGLYVFMYTCTFAVSNTGYRQIGFSTSDNDIAGLGYGYLDSQAGVSTVRTQLSVNAIFEVSASSYPNGRTFYLLAYQNTGGQLTAYPRCYYLKF